MATHEEVLGKIQKLIAKAKGNTTVEEAEQLVAKAQELMMKYSIDEAMLKVAGAGSKEEIGIRYVAWSNSYEPFKGYLLEIIARHNNVKILFNSKWILPDGTRGWRYHLIGFPAETAYVEMLFASVWLQCFHAGSIAWRNREDRDARRPRFWHSFIDGWNMRIENRMREANVRIVKEESHKRTGVELALRDRNVEIEVWMANRFGKLKPAKGTNQKLDHNARYLGYEAAATADISGSKNHVTRGATKQINR